MMESNPTLSDMRSRSVWPYHMNIDATSSTHPGQTMPTLISRYTYLVFWKDAEDTGVEAFIKYIDNIIDIGMLIEEMIDLHRWNEINSPPIIAREIKEAVITMATQNNYISQATCKRCDQEEEEKKLRDY